MAHFHLMSAILWPIFVVFRIEPSISVLVCSRGGGGLLYERMELVAELWTANIKVGSKSITGKDWWPEWSKLWSLLIDFHYFQAQFVPQEDPSLQEQYEYASDHDIKCLVFITESGVSQTDLVKVNTLKMATVFFINVSSSFLLSQKTC
jgi:translation initiation factor 2-alpha kinase 4